MTVRMSCSVTANFICDTSALRRASASNDKLPATRIATTANTATTAMPTTSMLLMRNHHKLMLPVKSNGPAIFVSPNVTAVCHARSAVAMAVVSQRGNASAWASNAAMTNSDPTMAPANAPQMAQPASEVPELGTRRLRSWLAVPPANAPMKA